MTISTTVSKKFYNGAGTAGPFNFPFKVFATSDVDVFVSDVLKTEGTHYTVVLNGTPPGVSGADVTFTAGNFPPVGTNNVLVKRLLPQTQEVDLPTAGAFPADTVEESADRGVMLIQQFQEALDRAIILGVTSQLANLAFPEGASAVDRAGKAIRWDAAGTALELVTITGGLLSVITTRGDLIRGGVSGITERLALGATDALVGSNGTDLVYFSKATQAEAEAGTDNAKWMTALRSAQAIAALTSAGLRSGLTGLSLANNGADATNDIDIAIGETFSNDAVHANRVRMTLTSALIKQLDAAWAVGTNAGMRDTGAIADGTWHIFLIKRTDTGVVDVLASQSFSAPTMPTSYDKRKWIGVIRRSGAAIIAFDQKDDTWLLDVPVTDVNTANPGTAAVTATLTSVPTGVNFFPILMVRLNWSGVGDQSLLLTALDQADTVPTTAISSLGGFEDTGANARRLSAEIVSVWTNTSAQIRYRLNLSDASTNVALTVKGYRVNRAEV